VTWSISAAGNEEAADEAEVIKALHKAFQGLPDKANLRTANLVTQHYGLVDLMEKDSVKVAEGPPDPHQIGRRVL
jgi:hypothetical protein